MKCDRWFVHQVTDYIAMIEWYGHKMQLRYKNCTAASRSSPKLMLGEYQPRRLDDQYEVTEKKDVKNDVKIFEEENIDILATFRSTII